MCDTMQCIKDELKVVESDCLTNSKDEVIEDHKPSLLNLPVELFLKICSFLDADFLNDTLSKVCIRFDCILADSRLWKHWLNSRMQSCFPALPHLNVWKENEPRWLDACVEIDRESRRWRNVNDTMRHIVIKDVHFASVDTVLLVQNGEICISGGRDRGVALWKVLSINPDDREDYHTSFRRTKPEVLLRDAHTGWVWDLAAENPANATLVYSASWDNTVKAWDLGAGFKCVETFQCGMSALTVAASENIVMTGLYSKKILGFDIRTGPQHVTSYKPHKGPVLALEHYDNKIASVSEDKTLAVWDRVAGKILVKDLKMPSNKGYPVCISWSPSALYVGDSKGSLHLIDPEELVLLKSIRIWPAPHVEKPASKITGCFQSLGNLILCSDKGEIKFLYNSYPPKEYTTVKATTFDVTQLRYQNDILVIGTCDSALEFWIPPEKYPELSL